VFLCRTRFVPPGARQGPNTRGRSTDGGLEGCNLPSTSSNTTREACSYNAKVTLGSTQYVPDSCAAEWLYKTSLTGVNTTRAPVCYPGSSFMYAHSNDCEAMSSDMRLSDLTPGGAGMDKCATPIGAAASGVSDKLVKADDLWSASVSYEHDPCGWAFVECVADCSLPSNPASKAWTVAANGSVMDSSKGLPVGCTNSGLPCDAQNVMKDPKVANKIAAM